MTDADEHAVPPASTGPAGRQNAVFAVINAVAAATFLVMILATTALVVAREILDVPAPTLDDLVRFMLLWSVYLGAGVLALRNDHIAIEVFYVRFPARLRQVVDVLIGLVGIALSFYLAYLGWLMTNRAAETGQTSMSGGVPAWWGYAAVPVGFLISGIAYAVHTARTAAHARRDEQTRDV